MSYVMLSQSCVCHSQMLSLACLFGEARIRYYSKARSCLSFETFAFTYLLRETRRWNLWGHRPFLVEVKVVLPWLVGLVEGPVLSYRGDGPMLTGGALVCVRLVVRVKSGTFYVDKRHDSASVTSITGGESFSSFVRCLRIDSVFPLCSNCFFFYV